MKHTTTTKLAWGKLTALASAVVLVFTIVSASVASSAGALPAPVARPFVCTGGNVPAGTYTSMVVTGLCTMSAGNILVEGDLTVAPGALLDAVTPGDPPTNPNPIVPATLVVDGNVFVGAGAVLWIGCSPNVICSDGVSWDRIGGNLTATGALGVVAHNVTVGGNATLTGGGGGVVGGIETGTCDSTPAPAPWSESTSPLAFFPVYSDFEDTTIGGNLNISGVQSCWIGSLRDVVGGSATFVGNAMGDPDAMEIDDNLVQGNMTCLGNQPAVQFGDSGSAPNIVGGSGIGECGFGVKVLSPAKEADEGPGILEHIAVSASTLGTYWGTHTQVGPITPIPLGAPTVTESGDTLFAEVNDAALTGAGLTGTANLEAGFPTTPNTTGEVVIATEYPNGSESFEAQLGCTCRFQGQKGTVTIRAYGTTSPDGVTSGTFFVTSGGIFVGGGLDTLAGYGSFSSLGEPPGSLRLVEHLKIT